MVKVYMHIWIQIIKILNIKKKKKNKVKSDRKELEEKRQYSDD